MGEQILEKLQQVNTVLWSSWTLYLLLGAGLLFSIWTKFSQFRILTHGFQVIRGKYDNPDDPGAINHFQALSAALSGTIGLGNIGGVALAVGLGGPGAVFWMWIVGILGMSLKMVEITLAMLFRNTDDPDNPHGGAMWVIDKTLGAKGGGWLVAAKVIGGFFCVSLLMWTMIGGNLFQSWNVAELTNTYFGVPQVGTGIVLAILVGMVIIGGIKRIGNVAGKFVPLMCILYLLSALTILAMHITEIPAMLGLIVKHAFTPTAPVGAFVGGSVMLAFSQGMKRALFSNEAGTGSAPIAHAAAKTNEPAREGIVGGMGPFIDTLVICTLSALVIIATGTWDREPMGKMTGEVQLVEVDGKVTLQAPVEVSALPDLPAGNVYHPGSAVFFVITAPDRTDPTVQSRTKLRGELVEDELGNVRSIEWQSPPPGAQWLKMKDGTDDTRIFRDFKGASLTSHAFDREFPGLGKWLVTLAAALFALSTIITWSYYGEQCIFYLFAGRGILVYKIIFLALVITGPVIVGTGEELEIVLSFGTGWALVANMIIVLSMGYLAARSVNDYLKRLKRGEFNRK